MADEDDSYGGDDLYEAYEEYDRVETPDDDEDYEYEHVTLDRDDGVFTITLNRPEEDNLIHDYMSEDLRRATGVAYDDDDIDCVVLRGTEGVFSTGLDLDTFEGNTADDMLYRVLSSRAHTAISNLEMMRKPVIAGVDGPAIDGGFGFALACDIVLVDEDAVFEFSYPEFGLAGDCGLTYFLPRTVGRRRAREIAMLQEPIQAEEAVEMGLATEVVPSDSFDERLDELATRLAGERTEALGETKRLLNTCYEQLLPDHLDKEGNIGKQLVDAEDDARHMAARQKGEDPESVGDDSSD